MLPPASPKNKFSPRQGDRNKHFFHFGLSLWKRLQIENGKGKLNQSIHLDWYLTSYFSQLLKGSFKQTFQEPVHNKQSRIDVKKE